MARSPLRGFVFLSSPLQPSGKRRARNNADGRPAVRALHAEGIGRSIWPRRTPLDQAQTEQRLDRLLCNAHLRQLPDLLHKHRRAIADLADPAHDWVLLWDDPNRGLPDLRYRDLNRPGGKP